MSFAQPCSCTLARATPDNAQLLEIKTRPSKSSTVAPGRRLVRLLPICEDSPTMQIRKLDHAALPVADVERSSRFYSQVLDLEAMARPAFSFPGAWFRIGPVQELHLIGGGEVGQPLGRQRHFAMLVDDIEATAAELRAKQVEFVGPGRRPDGAMQIFLADPDGHWVELYTDPPG